MSALGEAAAAIPRRERILLLAAVLLGLGVRLAFVAATQGHELRGDEYEYDLQGRFWTEGKLWWSTTPFGEPHASLWKAPVYPAWVGLLYSVFGAGASQAVYVVQALVFGSATIFLTWLIARRWFDPRVALGAAFVVAVYPYAWVSEVRLFSEAIGVPLFLLFVWATVDREPTWRRAGAVGALAGVLVLTRPAWGFVLGGALAAWWVRAGWRRAVPATVLAAAVAALVVAPWTVRNAVVDGGFVPVSLQDAAPYGTFNDDAANDPNHRWAWRPHTSRDAELFRPENRVPDHELRSELRHRALEYIRENPASVPKAFVWNGIIRTWDVWIPGVLVSRRPANVANEAVVQGRSRRLSHIAQPAYYVLLALALAGAWLHRRRREILIPLLTLAALNSVALTAIGSTRYREPLEPLIAILAVAAVAGLATRVSAPRATGPGGD